MQRHGGTKRSSSPALRIMVVEVPAAQAPESSKRYTSGIKVMPVKVLDSDGLGRDSGIIAGVVHGADNGAKVILMGFSAPGFSQSLQDAVEHAWSEGAVLVAATGNAGSTEPAHLAGDAKVVGVSATDQAGALWSGSKSGAAAFVAAPGVGIVAGGPGGGTAAVTGTSGFRRPCRRCRRPSPGQMTPGRRTAPSWAG